MSPSMLIEPGETFTLADIDGPGAIQQIWMTPGAATGGTRSCASYWDDQEQPSVECPVGDFFAMRLGDVRAGLVAAVCVNPGAPSTATGRCRSASARASRWRTSSDELLRLLPDQLHADRRARGRRLLPRPVPPHQPAAVQGGLHDPRRREGPGPLRRHVHGVGRQQHRLVGRGRDQVLPRRRRRVPDDLRHRHRGLLLRRVQLRPGSTKRAPSAATGSSPRPTPGCRR